MTEGSEGLSEYAASQFDLPIAFVKDGDGGTRKIGCLYCDYEVVDFIAGIADIEFRRHAMERHWWGPSEKFLNPPDMAVAREQRRRFKDVMGEDDTVTRAMNAMGL